MYHKIAFLYDEFAGFDYPEKIALAVEKIFNQFKVALPGLIGDFGAGTGTISQLLAQQGWSVLCIEQSDEMIERGKTKVQQQPLKIQQKLSWMQADISSLDWPSHLELDGAVCLCNTLNHLQQPAQVTRFAASAYQALKPNGVFVMDSDTLETFQVYFHHNPVLVWDKPPYKLYRTSRFEESLNHVFHIARLEETTESGLNVIEEPLELHYYSEAWIQEVFEDAGFKVELCMPFNPFPERYTGDFIPKFLWVFRRP